MDRKEQQRELARLRHRIAELEDALQAARRQQIIAALAPDMRRLTLDDDETFAIELAMAAAEALQRLGWAVTLPE